MAVDRGSFVPTGSPPAKLPLLPPVGERGKSIGLIGLLGVTQLFFLLLSVNNAPVLGGNWGSFEIPFFVYMVMLALAALLSTRIPMTPLSQKGTTRQFFLMFGLFLIITITVLGIGFHYLGNPPAILGGGAQISNLVYYLVFVAPTEELFFRVVLSELVGWPVGLIAFAGFHLGAYSFAASGISGLIGALFNALILGAILLTIYDVRYQSGSKKGQRIGGFGGCSAAHAGYDLIVSGTVGGFGLAAAHLVLPLLPF